MKKRLLGIALAAVLAVGALTGCGSSTDETASQGGEQTETTTDEGSTETASGDTTVVVGVASDLKTLDPGHMYEVFGNMIAYATYDMLFRINGDDLTPQPSLVTDWSLDEARTTYTFTLRDDVTFTSGNPLTSKDVVWSINRVRNLKSNTIAHVEGIVSVEAPDDYTVVVTLAEPDASFLTKLASNAFCVLDSEVVKANGGTDAEDASTTDTARTYLDQNSAGSGPYKLVSWTPNVELVLEKNENYWGETGNVDRYIIREIPDSNTQIQMLEKGEIDIAFTLSPDNINQLEGKEGVEIISGQTASCTFLLMNDDPEIGGPMSDPNVQQAVRLAIDYAGLKALGGEGCALPLSIVPNGFVGAKERPEDYQDVEQAKALLAEAGYADGFDITLTTANYDTEGTSWVTMAQKIQSDLAAVNINVNIETSEIGVVIDEYREGTCPFLIMHWSPDYYDINNQLAFLPGDTVGERANWPVEGNEDILEVGSQIVGEADNEKRAQLSEQLQDMIAEDSPYGFLLQHAKNFAVSTRLDNVIYNNICKLQLADITVQ